MTRNGQASDLYIDGRWCEPVGAESISVFSPTTEEQIGVAPGRQPLTSMPLSQRPRALGSAEWAGIGAEGRAAILMRLADELEANATERASLTSTQNGMPIVIAGPAEGVAPVAILRYYAAFATQMPAEERRPRLGGGGETVVRREPVGVVAAIVPWNYPQVLTMFKLAPALAAGCTMVLKPAPETTLDALELAAAAHRAGMPAGCSM